MLDRIQKTPQKQPQMSDDNVKEKRAERRRLRRLVPGAGDVKPQQFNISVRLSDDLGYGVEQLRRENPKAHANSKIVHKALTVYFDLLDRAREDDDALEVHKLIKADTALRVKNWDDEKDFRLAEEMEAIEKLRRLVDEYPQLASMVPALDKTKNEKTRVQQKVLMNLMQNKRIKNSDKIMEWLEARDKDTVTITVVNDRGEPINQRETQAALKKMQKSYDTLKDTLKTVTTPPKLDDDF